MFAGENLEVRGDILGEANVCRRAITNSQPKDLIRSRKALLSERS